MVPKVNLPGRNSGWRSSSVALAPSPKRRQVLLSCGSRIREYGSAVTRTPASSAFASMKAQATESAYT